VKIVRVAAAWLFGYIPAEIREDIETKHPDLHLVGFKRGSSVNLPDQDPRDRFVAIPELWGWGVLRDGPPKRRRRVFALRPATAALLLALASPLAAQEPEPPADAKPPVSTASIEVEKQEVPLEPGLYAAAFCTQREGEDDPSARCDLGVAVPLYHRVSPETRRGWAVVGFLGGGGAGEGEDLGIAGVGASWLFPVGERQGGLGLGWSVLWGGEGIDVADGRLTVGFTIGGRR
jgi:hypothetical protein